MKIDGKTHVCGLLGNPVEHTKSPDIHNTLSDNLGINMVYVPFKVENDDVEAAVRGIKALNLLGVNVTVPHKSAVIPYLEEIDALAKRIGAVNTLVRTKNGYKGYNTDMTGLRRAMKSDGIDLEKERPVILGAGGAARAVAYLCGETGLSGVYMLNRTKEKAEAIAKEVNASYGREVVIPMALNDYPSIPGDGYFGIQSTNVGLYPDTEACVINDDIFFDKLSKGYDLIYRPAETVFMKKLKAQGKPAFNGLKMLLYQGIEAYEYWNDVKVTKEQADEILKVL